MSTDLSKDINRVKHMLDAAEEAVLFLQGKSKEALQHDRMLALAVLKDIEILGEAASKVSSSFQALHPHIPWKEIIGTRHRLIHGYFDVNLEIVWNTVSFELPPLISALRIIVAAQKGGV